MACSVLLRHLVLLYFFYTVEYVPYVLFDTLNNESNRMNIFTLHGPDNARPSLASSAKNLFAPIGGVKELCSNHFDCKVCLRLNHLIHSFNLIMIGFRRFIIQ